MSPCMILLVPHRPIHATLEPTASIVLAHQPAALLVLPLALAPRAEAFVYWANCDHRHDRPRQPRRHGRRPELHHRRRQLPSGVAVDAAHVYWTNGPPTRSAAPTSTARASTRASSPARRAPRASRSTPRTSTGPTRHRHDRAAPTSTARASTRASSPALSGPQGVAVDAAHVYWTQLRFSTNTIGRANLDGTGVDQSFISGAAQPSGVAVDAAHVYWTNRRAPRTIGRANLDGSGVDQSFIDRPERAHGRGGRRRARLLDQRARTIGRANLDGSGVEQSFITIGAGPPFALAVNFSVGKLKKANDKGTAELTLEVPAPGEIALAQTKKVKGAEVRADAAGEVQLPIKPRGKAKKKLAENGKVKVGVEVTYTPDGGEPERRPTSLEACQAQLTAYGQPGAPSGALSATEASNHRPRLRRSGANRRRLRAVTATEFAQLGAEQAPIFRFAHWPPVRRCALGLYFVALVAWSAHYGIPVQRELVIAWTCGALACASLGRHPREIAPAGARLAADRRSCSGAYDLTRGAADSLGIGVHAHPMIDFDRFLFFGETPTEWLQAHIYEPGVVERLGRRLHPRLHLLLHRPVRGRRRALGPRPRRLPALHAGGWCRSPSPVSPPTSSSRRRRPGWRREMGLLDDVDRTTAEGWEVLGGGTAGCSRRARRASTWSPRSPRCTPPSRRWWRCSSGAASARGCGRCWRCTRWRWALTLMATGEHYFFDVAARLALRRRGDGGLEPVGAPVAVRARRGDARVADPLPPSRSARSSRRWILL